MDRRTFLKSVAGLTATSMLPLDSYAQQHKGKVKITDVKCMIVRGTWDWNLIKIETDSGLYGIGEAYWGWGVKDLVVNKLKPIVVGEDPLNVDKLYTKMLMQSAGAGAIAGVTMTAASGIEIALVGPGGPDPRNACRATCWAAGSATGSVSIARCRRSSIRGSSRPGASRCGRRRAEKFGWTAFKFQGDGVPPKADPEYKEPGHDPYTRGLTLKDFRRIGRAWRSCARSWAPMSISASKRTGGTTCAM